MHLSNKCLLFISFVASFCIIINHAFAENPFLPVYSQNIDANTIIKGYELKGFNEEFQIAIFPHVLKSPTRIELKDKTQIFLLEKEKNNDLQNASIASSTDIINTQEEFQLSSDKLFATSTNIRASSSALTIEWDQSFGQLPAGWTPNSDVYEFDVNDKSSFDGKKPFVITIEYKNETKNQQKIFYYDNTKKIWEPLPSTIMNDGKSIRAIIQLPYAKLAIFENTEVPSIGTASWYKYKGCNCAASPDYPKGTKLKVTALHNNKSVIVTVNDYGPDRDKFPERVIDLDSEAFKVLASPRAGVIDVKVEPLEDICSYAFQKAKHPETLPPQIKAKYAILIDEPTEEVLYAKNENQKTPMASITKLMTASIFLDLNPQWEKIIPYNKADDLEGAKLYVNDGETMTIKDIFYSMLVGSANNAAKTLVRYSGLSEKDYIQGMNKKAQEWDLQNTEFKEPSGLNVQNQSTAHDLAKMAKNVFKNFEMLEATTLEKYSFKTINTKNTHTIKTTNKLLSDKDLYITGAKTGYLEEAGHCLIVKAKNKNDGREVIGVILGENTSDERFEDMKNLIQWGLE